MDTDEHGWGGNVTANYANYANEDGGWRTEQFKIENEKVEWGKLRVEGGSRADRRYIFSVMN